MSPWVNPCTSHSISAALSAWPSRFFLISSTVCIRRCLYYSIVSGLALDADAAAANLRHPDGHGLRLQEAGLHEIAAVTLDKGAASRRQIGQPDAQDASFLGVAAEHDASAHGLDLRGQRVKRLDHIGGGASHDDVQIQVARLPHDVPQFGG